ncbi:Kinesin-like protein KIF15 [Eumeta japonica]|uniref:Kinesin-like protein KIF15 n=1 Tax=Eumeta variegata TaxID=151549 RepID=A0A4C1ZY78_EUMVA|nr:Kinesin-like protein KIF15 [Eumeta japonica]
MVGKQDDEGESEVIKGVNSGLGRDRFVPYRDSSLTWLLKDCFTGGAAAFIIATVSPSAACYGESASTLRWASRARRLPAPPARRALSPPTRALLQAQLADLLAALSLHNISYVPETKKLIFDKAKLFENNGCNACVNKMDEKKNLNIGASKSESTTSSVASGSSEKIFSNEKIIISGEVDNLFGPSLGRTRSGSDINLTTPLKNKRRQYRSQEVLPVNTQLSKSQLDTKLDLSSENICASIAKEENVTDSSSDPKTQVRVPLLYDNQRAEIVSSVTERLYSKLKKREETAVSKMESIVDRKIMEPLSELRICTNARQRLVDLSQKALKNKRRIGIPAYTQTRPRITRVREQGTDAQSDLEFYVVKDNDCYKLYQNVATETVPLTPRCKEIAVGSKYGFLYHREKSAATNTRLVSYKNSCVMTDEIVKFERYTQTPVIPPPRRKRRIKKNAEIYCDVNHSKEDVTFTPIVSINISQEHHTTPDTTSESDEPSENSMKNTSSLVPPDLLSNHSTENKIGANEIEVTHSNDTNNSSDSIVHREMLIPTEDFPDSEEHSLPRVKLSPGTNGKRHFQNIIMGRNNQMYPYNIELSPSHERSDSYKKSVKFKDETFGTAHIGVQTRCDTKSDSRLRDTESESDQSQSEKGDISSASIKSSKSELDIFVWKSGNTDAKQEPVESQSTDLQDDCGTCHYKLRNESGRRKEKAKLYKEFLGLKKRNSLFTKR